MPKYYLLDENKNLVEGYDKEGFLALLEEAIENGDLEHIDEDSAFVSKFKSLLNGTTHHFEFVTQAQYNQLVADEELQPNTYYFITDDTTLEGLEEDLNNLATSLEQIINGDRAVPRALSSENAEKTSFTNNEWIETSKVDGSDDAKIPNFNSDNLCLCFLKVRYSNFAWHTVNLGIMTMFDVQDGNLRSDFPSVYLSYDHNNIYVSVDREGRVRAEIEHSGYYANAKFVCKVIK